MAQVTSGTVKSNTMWYSTFYVKWSRASYSVDTNQSKLNWEAGLITTSGVYWLSNAVKINSVYINGTKVLSNKTYSNIKTNGTHKLASGTITIDHEEDGNKSFEVSISGWLYDTGSPSGKGSFELPTIPRTSKAVCSSFDIGGNPNISITKYISNSTATIRYALGSLSGTIVQNFEGTSYVWEASALANQIYAEIPNANTLTGTIYTDTYDSSGTQIGSTQESTFTCNVVNSNPVINSVKFEDTLKISTTGNIVRYLSNLQVTINATAKNGANLSGGNTKFRVTETNGNTITETDNVVTFGIVSNNTFTIQVTDSRGNLSEAKMYGIDNFVEYVKPAITYLAALRTGEENLTSAAMVIRGQWYNATINGSANTLAFKYRYKLRNSDEWSGYTTFTPSENIYGGSFELEEVFTPSSGFDINQVYDIEVAVTDKLVTDNSGSQTTVLSKAIPLTDHWNYGDKDYYNINAEIQQNGVSIFGKVIYEGDSNEDIYLDESAENFDYLEIVFRNNDGYYSSTKVDSPNGKTICLANFFLNDNYLYWKAKSLYVNGTVLEVVKYAEARQGHNVSTVYTLNNNIFVTKVIGYKK